MVTTKNEVQKNPEKLRDKQKIQQSIYSFPEKTFNIYYIPLFGKIIRLMLLKKMEASVERSLDRLRHESSSLQAHQLLPSLYYCSDLLQKYATSTDKCQLKPTYFRQFKSEIQIFKKKDNSRFKIHHKEIVEEIQEHLKHEIYYHSENHSSTLQLKIQQSINPNPKSLLQTEKDPSMKISAGNSVAKPSIEQANNINLPSNKNQGFSTGETDSVSDEQEKKLYLKIKQVYEEHRIDEAFELKQDFAKKYAILSEQRKEFFDTIDLQYNTMMSFYKEFDQDGWELDKEENGIRLQYKVYEQQKQVGVKVSAELNVPIEHFLATVSEIDLFEKYVPFVYDSRQLKAVSRNEKLGHSKVFIPLLTDREVYFYAAGYDRMKKNGSVFLFSKTLNDDLVYQEKYGYKVPQQSEYVRLEYKFYIIEYTPIDKSRAKVRLACKVDLKLNFLPMFIINISARKFAFDYFRNIPKLSRKFQGSDWEKKIKQNPEFYDFFKKKISHYINE